jgi:nucleotide-binding universal stress UspA family protein
MPIRRIVVAFDGSPPARRALAFAEELAQGFGSTLTLVHAIQVPVTPPEAAIAGWTELLAAEQRASEAMLEDARQTSRRRGLTTACRVVVGAPAEQLAQVAAESEVDLVVAGTTGKGAMARIFLGSVTTRLLHISPKAVLVVP